MQLVGHAYIYYLTTYAPSCLLYGGMGEVFCARGPSYRIRIKSRLVVGIYLERLGFQKKG